MQVRNTFPHISSRDLPCHKTKKILFLHQVFPEAQVGSFSLAPAEILDSNISLSFATIFIADFTLSECFPNIRDQEMMLVLPDQRLLWEFSKSVSSPYLSPHFFA